jgi:hypothetical protein
MTYHNRTYQDVAAVFGVAFVAQLERFPPGEWQLLQAGRHWHVIRLVARTEGKATVFKTVRQQVEADWRQEREQKLALEIVHDMRESYKIRRSGGP